MKQWELASMTFKIEFMSWQAALTCMDIKALTAYEK